MIFTFLSFLLCYIVVHELQQSTVMYWMGWGKRMRGCVCQSMSPSHLLYKGSLSGVEELLAEWHSCLTEQSRNLWSTLWQLNLQEEHLTELSDNYRYVHFLFKRVLLCSASSWWLYPWFFWGQGTSVEARTGYLSGYISSSALNVCVCEGIASKVQSIPKRQYIIHCLFV